MAEPLVTVIVPTFDHVRTLEHSVPTALAQSHTNLEVIVIGDGAPDETREVVAELTRSDSRVRYEWFPKGERNGEAHRHGVLTDIARGEFVFYLSDDDLWLPEHVETLLELMLDGAANFVCCQPMWIVPDPAPDRRWVVDLGLEYFREELLAGRNRVPLACAAHTMQLYRALPHGWRTTPNGTPTDLHMWKQLLAHPECVGASTAHITTIGLPASQRVGAMPAARVAELAVWANPGAPEQRVRLLETANAAYDGLLDHARREAQIAHLRAEIENTKAELHARSLQVDDVSAVAVERDLALRKILKSRTWRAAEFLRHRILRRGSK